VQITTGAVQQTEEEILRAIEAEPPFTPLKLCFETNRAFLSDPLNPAQERLDFVWNWMRDLFLKTLHREALSTMTGRVDLLALKKMQIEILDYNLVAIGRMRPRSSRCSTLSYNADEVRRWLSASPGEFLSLLKSPNVGTSFASKCTFLPPEAVRALTPDQGLQTGQSIPAPLYDYYVNLDMMTFLFLEIFTWRRELFYLVETEWADRLNELFDVLSFHGVAEGREMISGIRKTIRNIRNLDDGLRPQPVLGEEEVTQLMLIIDLFLSEPDSISSQLIRVFILWARNEDFLNVALLQKLASLTLRIPIQSLTSGQWESLCSLAFRIEAIRWRSELCYLRDLLTQKKEVFYPLWEDWFATACSYSCKSKIGVDPYERDFSQWNWKYIPVVDIFLSEPNRISNKWLIETFTDFIDNDRLRLKLLPHITKIPTQSITPRQWKSLGEKALFKIADRSYRYPTPLPWNKGPERWLMTFPQLLTDKREAFYPFWGDWFVKACKLHSTPEWDQKRDNTLFTAEIDIFLSEPSRISNKQLLAVLAKYTQRDSVLLQKLLHHILSIPTTSLKPGEWKSLIEALFFGEWRIQGELRKLLMQKREAFYPFWGDWFVKFCRLNRTQFAEVFLSEPSRISNEQLFEGFKAAAKDAQCDPLLLQKLLRLILSIPKIKQLNASQWSSLISTALSDGSRAWLLCLPDLPQQKREAFYPLWGDWFVRACELYDSYPTEEDRDLSMRTINIFLSESSLISYEQFVMGFIKLAKNTRSKDLVILQEFIRSIISRISANTATSSKTAARFIIYLIQEISKPVRTLPNLDCFFELTSVDVLRNCVNSNTQDLVEKMRVFRELEQYRPGQFTHDLADLDRRFRWEQSERIRKADEWAAEFQRQEDLRLEYERWQARREDEQPAAYYSGHEYSGI
jgi:hypothetical protein